MPRYRCIFPSCDYETDERSLIELHHVRPREGKFKIARDLVIPLCPTHHKYIYHPASSSGSHANRHEKSLTVESVCPTNTGTAVTFRDTAGEDTVVYLDNRVSDVSVYELSWNPATGLRERMLPADDDYPMEIDRDGISMCSNKVYFVESRRAEARRRLSDYVSRYAERMEREAMEAVAKAREVAKRLSSGGF